MQCIITFLSSTVFLIHVVRSQDIVWGFCSSRSRWSSSTEEMTSQFGLQFSRVVLSSSRAFRIQTARRAISPSVGKNLASFSTSSSAGHRLLLQRNRDRSSEPENYEVKFTQEELKQKLSPMQYHCTQERGTERAFTGEYVELKDDGNFHCVVCNNLLFKSSHKYDSGSGWPSFSDMAAQGTVKSKEDFSHGMARTEVVCAKCGAHLGHVFNDGPKTTGLRYCINSACLKFKEEGKPKSDL